EAGFQLTFLALLAIAGIGVPVLERTSTPYRRALMYLESTAYDLNLEPRFVQLRLDLRMIAGRLGLLIGSAPARWLVLGFSGAVRTGGDVVDYPSCPGFAHADVLPPGCDCRATCKCHGAAARRDHAECRGRSHRVELRMVASCACCRMDRRDSTALDFARHRR